MPAAHHVIEYVSDDSDLESERSDADGGSVSVSRTRKVPVRRSYLRLRDFGRQSFKTTYVVSSKAPDRPTAPYVTLGLLRETRIMLEDVLHVSFREGATPTSVEVPPWSKLEHMTSSSCSSTISDNDEEIAQPPKNAGPLLRLKTALSAAKRLTAPQIRPHSPRADVPAPFTPTLSTLRVVFDIPAGLKSSRQVFQRCFVHGVNWFRLARPHACDDDTAWTTGHCSYCYSDINVYTRRMREHQRAAVPQHIAPFVILYF